MNIKSATTYAKPPIGPNKSTANAGGKNTVTKKYTIANTK